MQKASFKKKRQTKSHEHLCYNETLSGECASGSERISQETNKYKQNRVVLAEEICYLRRKIGYGRSVFSPIAVRTSFSSFIF
jgi:hypothetical protein